MSTMKKIAESPLLIPSVTAIYIGDIAESRGRQELYTKQSPQKLKTLREHALIESAISSNRIEGITIDRSRVGTVVFGRSILRDRDEEEVRGYKEALKLIHDKGPLLHLSEETVKHLHYLSRSGAGDAGQYKSKDSDIIEKYPDGKGRVRFRTVSAKETLELSSEGWHKGKNDPWPYVNYVLYTLKTACIEFESGFSGTAAPRGSKRRMVEDAILSMKGNFSLSDVQDKSPGVSIDTIRKIFKEKQKDGLLECIIHGRDAKWRVK